jgi:predicted Rossmann fold nucleotide-binding protein DprA/Smf involved in DNA uptake
MNAEIISIPMPKKLVQNVTRVDAEIPESLYGIGNVALLDEPLLCVIASRSCPGNILAQTVERVPEWVKSGKVIASGFHSPLEQQVLRSALRRNGRVVKILARGISKRSNLRLAPEEAEAIASGKMLVITAFLPSTNRTTRETALARNRLVLALADEICIPWVDKGSPLEGIIKKSYFITDNFKNFSRSYENGR